MYINSWLGCLFGASDALRLLVDLKDGPRDEHYEQTKPLAWQAARDVLRELDAHTAEIQAKYQGRGHGQPVQE